MNKRLVNTFSRRYCVTRQLACDELENGRGCSWKDLLVEGFVKRDVGGVGTKEH
jgi:hypothetical protein